MTLNEFLARAAELFAAKPDNTEALTKATARIAELEANFAEQAGSLAAVIKERDEELAKVQADLKAAADKLEAESKKVVDTIAAVGIDPKAIPGENPKAPGATGADILEQFSAITDPIDRSAFYAKHKAEIKRAIRG